MIAPIEVGTLTGPDLHEDFGWTQGNAEAAVVLAVMRDTTVPGQCLSGRHRHQLLPRNIRNEGFSGTLENLKKK